jgi:hypothetical protein
MRRYSIMVRELGSKHEVELLQVNSNPQAIAAALETKCALQSSMGHLRNIKRYSSVRIVDNDEVVS